jgi:hypothetical protein
VGSVSRSFVIQIVEGMTAAVSPTPPAEELSEQREKIYMPLIQQ